METTGIIGGSVGIVEKKMETTTYYLGFRGQGVLGFRDLGFGFRVRV